MAAATPAVQAEALLERLRACGEDALAALAAGDEPALARILAERERLTRRAGPLLERLRSQRDRGAAARVVQTLRGVQRVDARLAAAVEARRREAASQLDRMSRTDRGSAGYQPALRASRGRRLDLVR